jgi:hypothetical protein
MTRALTLYDCLTREQLAEAYDPDQESWKRKKEALKANMQNDSLGIR